MTETWKINLSVLEEITFRFQGHEITFTPEELFDILRKLQGEK